MKTVLFPKQLDVVSQGLGTKLTILDGPVRCGKTITECFLAGEAVSNAFRHEHKPNFLAIAQSISNCHSNIANNLRSVWCIRPEDYDRNNKNAVCPEVGKASRYFTFLGAEVECVGWNRITSSGKILGKNIDGIWIDEGVLVPEEIFINCMGRLDRPWANCIVTTNPGPTRHYLKTNFIDKCDGVINKYHHFKLSDNPSLPEEYLTHLKNSYSGVFYRRYVLGEWCDATGLIYPFFGDKHIIAHCGEATEYIVGFDFGMHHKTAGILIGINLNKHPSVWVEREYVTDPNAEKFSSITSIIEHFWRWLLPITPSCIYVDPAATPAYSELVQNPWNIPVSKANNEVSDGIASVMKMFCSGRLKILNSCENLIQEMYTYSWDEKKSISQAKDVPLKERDDCVDALRYALFTRFGRELSNDEPQDIIKPVYNPFIPFADLHNQPNRTARRFN